MTATATTALVPIQPAFSDAERLALAGFLAAYRGLTREAYALDLRQFTTWCRARSPSLFAVRRADIEGFARDLEARGRARATVTRRLCTIAGFYRYAVEEELLEHSPAAHVRRPRVDYESHAVALDSNELGALLVAAGLGPVDHLLLSFSTGRAGGPFQDLAMADFAAAVAGKLVAYLSVLQASLGYLRADGSVTLVGAGSAEAAPPATAGLAAVNGGLHAAARPLAVELAPLRLDAVAMTCQVKTAELGLAPPRIRPGADRPACSKAQRTSKMSRDG
jgi:hypothetical protein